LAPSEVYSLIQGKITKKSKLPKLVLKAKNNIVWHLRYHCQKPCNCRDLMLAVIDCLSIHEKRDGTISRNPLPIHHLAFIIAYKRLEEEGKIAIQRSPNVPFPATDFNSVFSLRQEEHVIGKTQRWHLYGAD
jgi:hypothetical protein